MGHPKSLEQNSPPGGTGTPEQHVPPLQQGIACEQCAVGGAHWLGQQSVQLGS
jgi:hypothetical protein